MPDDPAAPRKCRLPPELYYDVANHVWVRPEGDDLYTLGITDVGQTLAGELLFCEPKPVGTAVAVGKATALIESGKSIWPVRCPVAGTVAATNPEAAARPATINADPYGAGWIVQVRSEALAGGLARLVTGEGMLADYRLLMEDIGFGECIPNRPGPGGGPKEAERWK